MNVNFLSLAIFGTVELLRPIRAAAALQDRLSACKRRTSARSCSPINSRTVAASLGVRPAVSVVEPDIYNRRGGALASENSFQSAGCLWAVASFIDFSFESKIVTDRPVGSSKGDE
ncbi:hypothetical protein [Kitasatospora sp. NPDC088351]|uniref:hypothetical protein n=1 Tax=Kitasatospora sp. NPDC088351 TaxID=3155180 RepID=UPI0034226F56